jgi:hypothetical protein
MRTTGELFFKSEVVAYLRELRDAHRTAGNSTEIRTGNHESNSTAQVRFTLYIIKYHTMNVHGGVELQLHYFNSTGTG